MKKVLTIALCGIGIWLSGCSQKNHSGAADDPKAVPVSSAPVPHKDTLNYLSEAKICTDQMVQDLKLNKEQEALIKNINQQRALKLNNAIALKNSNENNWLTEVSNINEWTAAEYHKVMTQKQYSQLMARIGDYESFEIVSRDFIENVEAYEKVSDYEMQVKQ